MNSSKSIQKITQGIISLILILLGLLILYPLYYTFMVSICQYRDILE